MRIIIAGGHGKIALLLTARLVAGGHTVVGIVRNPDHIADVRAAGGDAVLLDLESAGVDEVTAAVDGADVAVFAAGAGPGSGAARKDTVDRGAAVLFADAAQAAKVQRFLQVSAMGLDRADDQATEPGFATYLRAKAAAEQDLTARPLDWTILRPGRLTDDPATGRVTIGPRVPAGSVSRDDVAAVLVALLDTPATAGRTLELVGGDTPIDRALDLP
ncbi:SDR family oxidoreductase [Actinophytocola sediminis]